MTAYIALLRKDPGSDYGVDFPDFPGCVTAGKTLEDARRMAAEALALQVEGMLEDREARFPSRRASTPSWAIPTIGMPWHSSLTLRPSLSNPSG